jgi:D-glycerate 3-kinase
MPDWPVSTLTEHDRSAADYSPQLQGVLHDYLASHQLNESFSRNIPLLYQPMADWLAKQHERGKPLFVGINGAQGSGKSTLTGLLKILLEKLHDRHVLSLSIDDLYLTLHERKQLASSVHPLLITRGVPGTHDMSLASEIFDAIRRNDSSAPIVVPCFDKSIDDRLSRKDWSRIEGPIDIVLFEGWCVGAQPQTDDELLDPVNELESREDPQAIWRSYVNEQLAGQYNVLFNQLDLLMMLKVPSMEQVYEWRGLQETKLKQSSAEQAQGVMDTAGLKRFIMHYERLTRHQLDEMPQRADVLMPLDKNHQIADVMLHPS